ncbi:hypothetical protein EZV62_021945 [Acer yangbiense]|uniref:RNase H type-1 domain-containing protein n=1 Tax=Acer yangbiense TaxID=1000413 RepID=A0A5C7H9G1_9ROSI|nr:hypothetical protein EZV62_021945 [Acer yangbiense]
MWHYDGKISYTVKSDYWIARNLMSSTSSSNYHPSTTWWTFLWKLGIPLKVKIFIWKACHNWIPTKFNIAHRERFKRVAYVMLVKSYNRNSIAHGSKLGSMDDVCNWSKAFLNDFINASLKNGENLLPTRNQVLGRWLPPVEKVYKANYAALVDRVGGWIGIGVVIRDSNGDVLTSYAQTLLVNLNSKSANLAAMLKNVHFSVDCGLAMCIFETNEALVMKWINESQCNFSKNGVLLDDIRSLSSNMRNVKFVHTSKKANGVAQILAKHALEISKNTFWMEDFLSCINALVLANKLG